MKLIMRLCTLIVFLSCLASCSASITNTTSYIQIISKEIEKKNTHLITVKNPYDKQAMPFKITIKNENIWNLIEVDRIYFSSYEYKDINKKIDLQTINYPAEPK